MTTPQVQIEALRAYVRDLDHSLTEGRIPPQGLDDLKTAVDELRSRVWAIMTAAASPDGPQVLERFRLRRATENVQRLTEETRAGTLSRSHREFTFFVRSLREFLAEAEAAPRA